MTQEEQEIRALLEQWRAATAAGDVDQVLRLVSEEAVFLRPGQAPLQGRAAFEREQRAALQRCSIASQAEIREVRVHGDLASCWSELAIVVTPHAAGTAMRLAGPTLTVLERGADRAWRVVQDANMLTPAAGT